MASGYQTEGYATDVIRLWTDSHQFRTWKSGVTSVEARVREHPGGIAGEELSHNAP